MTERNEPIPAATEAESPVNSAHSSGAEPATPAVAPAGAGGADKAAAEAPQPPAGEASSPRASPGATWLAALPPPRGLGGVMLLGVLLIALLGWQWLDLRNRVAQTQEQLARRLVDGAAQLREAQALAAGAREAQQEQATRITVLEAKLVDLNGQHAALEGLYQELSRGRDEWLLSEVDQLVGLAAQQLQIAGNLQAAVAALGNADARLARSERPQFVTLRKALAKDLQKLRSLPQIDSYGLALRIENVALATDKMTLAFESRPQNVALSPAVASKARAGEKVREPAEWTQWWQRWTAELWGELNNLIRIERFDRPEPALLAPQNAVFLRENLKLRLLGARLALLARDQASFKGELRQAVAWLDKYFDPRDRSVAGALETLKPLLATELSLEPPALSESQNALRAVKLAAERVVR